MIQISASDIGGGVETVVRHHHHELSRRGHKTQLLVGRKQTDDSLTTQIPFRRGPKGMLRAARWLQRTTGLENVYSPSFRAVERSFAFAPDVLHLHSLHGAESYAELSVLRRLSRRYPTVISVHDMWLMTGHCGHPLSCSRWRTGCGRCPDLTLYPAISRDATRWNYLRKLDLFRKARIHLIVPSRWVKEQVRQSPILRHLPVSIVPNPVDTESFVPGDATGARRRHGIGDHETTLVVVAQHLDNFYKGMKDGIEIINRLTTDNLRIILVGHSANVIAEKLRHPCIALPKTESATELASFYRMADVLLMPSRCETFGLVAAEAMACGVPVVAFDVGGLPEVIGDGNAGVVVPERNIDLLVAELSKLLADYQRRKALSEAAVMRIRERFTVSIHTERLLEIYSHLCRPTGETLSPRRAAELATV